MSYREHAWVTAVSVVHTCVAKTAASGVHVLDSGPRFSMHFDLILHLMTSKINVIILFKLLVSSLRLYPVSPNVVKAIPDVVKYFSSLPFLISIDRI